eukprot:gene19122-25733_t
MESAIYKDIVWFPNASYQYSNPDKVHEFFQWAVAQTPQYDFIIKADEFTYIQPFNLQHLLMLLPEQHAYWGRHELALLPEHQAYWGRKEASEVVDSAFMDASMFVVSRDIVEWITKHAALVKASNVCPGVPESTGCSAPETQFESRQIGWWVAVAITALSDGDKLGGEGPVSHTDVKPLGPGSVQTATGAEW